MVKGRLNKREAPSDELKLIKTVGRVMKKKKTFQSQAGTQVHKDEQKKKGKRHLKALAFI